MGMLNLSVDQMRAVLEDGNALAAHRILDLISLDRGADVAVASFLKEIYPDLPLESLYIWFLHLDKLLEHTTKKEFSKEVLTEWVDYEMALEDVSFHNQEILISRLAYLGDENAMQWYSETCLAEKGLEIPVHVAQGAYESEKVRWGEGDALTALALMKGSFLQVAQLPDIAEEPLYYVDYLNTLLDEIAKLVVRKQVPFAEGKACFDALFALYKTYDLEGQFYDYYLYFQRVAKCATSKLPEDEWLKTWLAYLEELQEELGSAEVVPFVEEERFSATLMLCRLNPEEGASFLKSFIH